MRVGTRPLAAVLLLLPGAATAYLSFNAGGFFPGEPAILATVLAVILAVRAIAGRDPFAGLNRSFAVAAGALAGYCVWTLASVAWSGSLARALIETDRALLYLLALLLFGSVASTPARLRWMARGVATAIVVVCACALMTRLLPAVWTVSPSLDDFGLAYPLTYANALGLLAALGSTLCLHFASDVAEPKLVRVVAAATIPLLAVTLVLTTAVAAAASGALALGAYILVGRPKALATALLATAPTAAAAAAAALAADRITGPETTGAAATSQGRNLAIAVGLAAGVAALLRWLLLRFDGRPAPPAARRLPVRIAVFVAVAVAAVALVALDDPGGDRSAIADGSQKSVATGADVAGRRPESGLHGRTEQWRPAIDAFEESPMIGHGAGTYELLSLEDNPPGRAVLDAHSLYLEVLGELGVIGLLLLAGSLVAIVAGSLGQARAGGERVYAAVFALALGWVAHAAVDWDWEMPAVTIAVFALGGGALAGPAGGKALLARPSAVARALAAIAAVALALVPTRVATSQAELDTAVSAFRSGSCARSTDAARSSISALGARPEPYEILAYCGVLAGARGQPTDDMRRAVERDPDNPEFRHGLALTRALARDDFAAALLAARHLERLGRLGAVAADRLEIQPP